MYAYPVAAFTATRTLTVWVAHPDAQPLAKAGDIPTGARWITVHPNGRDEKGVPVLIQETEAGSGVHRVIGGAGGKLNYLKLRGVKSEGDYRKEVGERRKVRAEAKKAQRAQDKALGLDKKKAEAKRDLDRQIAEKQQSVVALTAEAMGWQGHEFDPTPYEGLSKEAQTKAYREHQRKLAARAEEAIDAQRKQLLDDHEARERVLGNVAAQASEETAITLPDLSPEPNQGGGLGYKVDYKGEAERYGATEPDIAAEKAKLDEARPDDVKAASAKRAATVQAIKAELDSAREAEAPPNTPIKLADAETAAKLLQARKELQLLKAQARKAKGQIDKATEDPGAMVLEVGGQEVDEALQRQFADDLRTASTVGFLSEVKKLGAETPRHIGIGAYNAMNSLATAVSGGGLIDRMAVDVLGVAGAAQVLARRLHTDLGPEEAGKIKEALEAFHVEHYMGATEKAIAEALRFQKAAEALETDARATGADLAVAQEVAAKRRESIGQARRIMGQTLGEMEGNAAMISALGKGARDSIEVPMGDMSTEAAVRRVRALGLQPGDYEINSVGSTRFLTLRASGMDRIAAGIDREGEAVTRRALDIQAGKEDEVGWLPKGMADRPDLAAKPPPGVAPRFAEAFQPGPDMAQSVRDYVGARAADGDAARDIVADLRSEDMARRAGERSGEYWAAVDKLAPLNDAKGKPLNADTLQGDFEKLADAYVQGRFGVARTPLHRQNIPIDTVATEAMHRALAAHPDGVAAFKPAGELTAKEQGGLRDWWWKEIGSKDNAADEARDKLKAMDADPPDQFEEDMFGDRVESQAWRAWKQQRDALAEEVNAAGLTWPKYAKVMGGPEKAYAAVQDMIKGDVGKSFADAYNTLNPSAPLKLGRAMIAGHLNHLDAVDPAARERRLDEHRQLVDGLRDRNRGQYASGAVSDKLDAKRAEVDAFGQAQMGLFGDDLFGDQEPAAEAPLQPGQRHTLGVAAERTLAGMAGIVGENFRAGKPVELWHSSMDGKYMPGQRAVKMLENSKRLLLNLGTGSGKTKIGLAAFAHLHSQGKVKRGIYAVPSVVQGQFGGEALRYLEPGKFKWHAESGANREERLAAYRDPDTHFSVVTHQALRDDLVHLGAKSAGISEDEMAAKVRGMSGPERKEWMRGVMADAGMDHDFLMVDEGHDLLNRAGKEDSLMAGVIDAVAHNTPYYVSASADPVKNDSSEIFSNLNKLDPERYNDPAAFKRRYGVDTPAAKEALRREMARYQLSGHIESGVKASHDVRTVPLSEAQHAELKGVEQAIARARLSRRRGSVDVDAIKTLSPSSFAGVDPGRHREVAENLAKNLGIVAAGAKRRVIDEHPAGAKLDEVVRIAKDKAGKPGVVFAHSRAAVAALERRLRAEGHRVVTITGSDSAKDKDRKRLMFHPEQGAPDADILIASDAAATGLNLQRGQWLAQFDTPDTAKSWHQRQGRINRLGQKQDIDLIDLVGDHPSERKARERLAKKDELRQILTSPLDGADDSGIAGYLARAKAEQQQGSLF